jgi:plastocyanin
MKKSGLFSLKALSVAALLFSLIIFSESCNKSMDNTMPSMTGSTGTSGGTGGPGANQVFIQGMAFNPLSINVAVNSSVTWVNKDAVGHSVTSDTGLFDSGTLNTNGSFTYTFTTLGTFSYHCSIHPSMTATVTVTQAANPTTDPGMNPSPAPVPVPGY